MHRLTRAQARRIAVRAQLLDVDRPTNLVSAVADRKAGVLRVNAIHEEVRFTRPMATAVRAELENLASWLGLGVLDAAATYGGR